VLLVLVVYLSMPDTILHPSSCGARCFVSTVSLKEIWGALAVKEAPLLAREPGGNFHPPEPEPTSAPGPTACLLLIRNDNGGGALNGPKGQLHVVHVPLSHTSLSQEDCFVLDAGAKVYTWVGGESCPFTAQKCTMHALKIAEERGGHTEALPYTDDEAAFWAHLGGEGDVQMRDAAAGVERSHAALRAMNSGVGAGVSPAASARAGTRSRRKWNLLRSVVRAVRRRSSSEPMDPSAARDLQPADEESPADPAIAGPLGLSRTAQGAGVMGHAGGVEMVQWDAARESKLVHEELLDCV
jgi:hypothetical protein